VKVARSDDGQARLGNPRERRMAVDQLPAVDKPGESVELAPEAAGGAPRRALRPRGVRRDDRRPRAARRRHRLLDSVLKRQRRPQPDRDRVRGSVRVCRVDGEFETRQQQQAVPRPGQLRLCLHLLEVVRQSLGPHSEMHPLIADRMGMVGDAENVEPCTAVERDEVLERKLTVAPGRMRVQLA